MPLTTILRAANPDNAADVQFCINAAAEAGALWDERTIRGYQFAEDGSPSSISRILILLAEWPEQFSGRRRAAMCLGVREGSAAIVQVAAIDPSTIPDRIDTRAERRAVMDRLIREFLEHARDRGATLARGLRVPKGSRMHDYILTVSGATVQDDARDAAFIEASMAIQPAIDFMRTRSG